MNPAPASDSGKRATQDIQECTAKQCKNAELSGFSFEETTKENGEVAFVKNVTFYLDNGHYSAQVQDGNESHEDQVAFCFENEHKQ